MVEQMSDDEVEATLRQADRPGRLPVEREVSKVCCVFCGEWLQQDEAVDIAVESKKHVGRTYRFYAHHSCFTKLAEIGPGTRGLDEL